jgi:hypothetical protein
MNWREFLYAVRWQILIAALALGACGAAVFGTLAYFAQ